MKDTENNYVPTSYEDLYLYYIEGKHGRSLARKIIRTILPFADEDETLDLLQATYLRIQQYQMLERFDKTKANFGGVIFFTVRSVCVNHLSRKSREPAAGLCAGTLVFGSGEDFQPGTYDIEKVDPGYEEPIDDRVDVSRLLDGLEKMKTKKGPKRDRNLHTLATLLLEGYEIKECAAVLKVTASTIHNWLDRIREVAMSRT